MDKTIQWRIVADSSCDLRTMENLPENLSYGTVPLKLRAGDREFVDNAALDTLHMMQIINNFNGKTSSACPSPEEWAEQFLKADVIVAVSISSNLSGSYNSALVAREMVLEHCPEKKIFVLDSLAAGTKLVILVRKIAQWITEGDAFEQVCEKAKQYEKDSTVLYVLSCFDNLVKAGRMSKLTGFVAGALGMRGVGTANEEGKIEILHKTRGETKALAFLLEEMDRRGFTGGQVGICHCDNLKACEMLRHGILKKWPDSHVEILPASGLCSYYAELNGVILGFGPM